MFQSLSTIALKFGIYLYNVKKNTQQYIKNINKNIFNNLECIPDSIYFTDDRWDEMDVDDSYGGHDIGFFNLVDHSIKPYYHLNLARIDPPPFWITPNLSMGKD